MSMQSHRSNFFFQSGVVLAGIGGLLLFHQLDILQTQHWLNLWATAFFVGGALKIINSNQWMGRLWGCLLLAAGGILQFNHLGYAGERLETVWPLLIIVAGLLLMYRIFDRPIVVKDLHAQRLKIMSIFGGGNYRIRAKNFGGGEMIAIFGGFDVDMREAQMEGDQATLDVVAFGGGGAIRVPATWNVDLRVHGPTILGGHSLHTRDSTSFQKTLIINLITFIGGVEIRN